MLKLTIEIKGDSTADLVDALDALTQSIEAGNTSGFDSNDSGNYHFDVAEAG